MLYDMYIHTYRPTLIAPIAMHQVILLYIITKVPIHSCPISMVIYSNIDTDSTVAISNIIATTYFIINNNTQ